MSTVCTFYAGDGISFLNLRFENDVKMYGTQTVTSSQMKKSPFENDVKMYGTQTVISLFKNSTVFENDVKMYGTQTYAALMGQSQRLRMM